MNFFNILWISTTNKFFRKCWFIPLNAIPWIVSTLYNDAHYLLHLPQVEHLLIGCILDGAVKGKIDQLSNTLFLEKEDEQKTLRTTSLAAWTQQITQLSEKLNVTASGGGGLRWPGALLWRHMVLLSWFYCGIWRHSEFSSSYHI